jgi:hypothetical protein
VDEELLKAAAALAARSGVFVEGMVERALRLYLEGPADVLRRIEPREELTDDEAMEVAIREIKAYRAGL